MGLPDSDYTAHLEDAATQMAATVPHAMATRLLARCCGIQLSVKASEQMVERRATALQALDLFHVKHRIWEVAHSLYGEHSARAREWAEIQAGRIEDGHPEKVLQALRFLKPQRRETRELVDKLHGYLNDNRDRMNYPQYRARGLRVSSSAVESASFHVTGARLKLQGMRWSPQGAGQMALLRADLFNESWEQRTKQILAA